MPRYMDSSTRLGVDTVGEWLKVLTETELCGIRSLRIQTGFFSSDSLGFIAEILQKLKVGDENVHVLIGSNNCETCADDVRSLRKLIGVPRPNAKLGVVSFEGGYFHPKVYHLERNDDSSCAYIGSANFTPPGIAGSHIEAGIILDTRNGDNHGILQDIATAIDSWFTGEKEGLYKIANNEQIDALLQDGILAAVRQWPSPTRYPGSDTTPRTARQRLRPLIAIPVYDEEVVDAAPAQGAGGNTATVPPQPAPTPATSNVSTPLARYPSYVLFEPNPTTPTYGAAALTGALLPGNAVGLIIKLNKDSARHFRGGTGTSNISIPVATLSTIRFGIFNRKFERPRGEFILHIKYFASDGSCRYSASGDTNIMAYGFDDGESGHGDIRMLVPAEVKNIRGNLTASGQVVPEANNYAILKWATPTDPEFTIEYHSADGARHHALEAAYAAAEASETLVGKGAAWLTQAIYVQTR